jgi:hypothetical protein
MLRVLLQYLLPLLLPFLLYFAYVALTRGRSQSWLVGLPWITLSIAGLALTAASLLVWTLTSGAPPDEVYVPPHLENGEVVPGHTERP